MHIHSPSERILTKHHLVASISDGTNQGAVQAIAGYDRAKVIFYSAPSGTGTTSNAVVQIGNASNGSDLANASSVWSSVKAFAQVTTAGGAQMQVMDLDLAYIASLGYSYFSILHTGAGGSPGGSIYMAVELYNSELQPVTQDNTVVNNVKH